MTRCIGCRKRLWFWQSSGHLVLSDWTARWHGACFALAKQRLKDVYREESSWA